MREIWSEDPVEIVSELRKNSDAHVSMTLLGPSTSPALVTLRSVVSGADNFLEFTKPEGVQLDGDLFVFYRRDDMQLMRGFELGPIRQTNRFFRVSLPEVIFAVQRRKFPRIYAAEGSFLSCAPQDSRRILHAQVIDVSMEGAKIFGDLTGLRQGAILAPLTLTLCFDDKRSDDVEVNIAEAVVIREIRVKEKVQLSFHFQPEKGDDLLKKYIELRLLEQEVYG